MRWPIGVPGPVRVSLSFSSRDSIVSALPQGSSLFILARQRPIGPLTQRAEEGLAGIAVGIGLEQFGPVARSDLAALAGWTRLAVPADLLHRPIELHRMAVRVEGEDGMIHAGRKLLRQLAKLDAMRFEEIDRVEELLIAPDLDAEGHHRRVLAQAERATQGHREE